MGDLVTQTVGCQSMELFSAWTHLISAIIAGIVGLVWILRIKARKRVKTGLIVMVLGTVLMFSMSGFYHLMPEGGTARLVLQYLDHAAIFVMIAATFTPIHLILFKGWFRWAPLSGVWGFAGLAILLKCLFFDGIPEWLSLSVYLAFGWVGGWSAYHILKRYGVALVKPLLYGGLAYSIGAVLEFAGTPVLVEQVLGAHQIFHLFVMLGVVCHWRFIAMCIERTMKTAKVGTKKLAAGGKKVAGAMDAQGQKLLARVVPRESDA